jgi:cytochrome b subunit of formate dehydrogenase
MLLVNVWASLGQASSVKPPLVEFQASKIIHEFLDFFFFVGQIIVITRFAKSNLCEDDENVTLQGMDNGTFRWSYLYLNGKK